MYMYIHAYTALDNVYKTLVGLILILVYFLHASFTKVCRKLIRAYYIPYYILNDLNTNLATRFYPREN